MTTAASETEDDFYFVKCWSCPEPHLERDCLTCLGRVYICVRKPLDLTRAGDLLAARLAVIDDLERCIGRDFLKSTVGVLYLGKLDQLRDRYRAEAKKVKP